MDTEAEGRCDRVFNASISIEVYVTMFLGVSHGTNLPICRITEVHRQADHAVSPLAVSDAPEVLAPRGLPGLANKISPGNVVVMSEFAATQAGEIGFDAIGAVRRRCSIPPGG
jgi:hypothetical protein